MKAVLRFLCRVVVLVLCAPVPAETFQYDYVATDQLIKSIDPTNAVFEHLNDEIGSSLDMGRSRVSGLEILDFTPAVNPTDTPAIDRGQGLSGDPPRNTVTGFDPSGLSIAFGPELVLSAHGLNVTVAALPLVFGEVMSATIDAQAKFDAYSFEAAAGDKVRIRMVDVSGSTAGMMPVLKLFNGSWSLIASNGGLVSTMLELRLDMAGTYYLLASTNRPVQGGSYGLSVHRLNMPVGATPLVFGEVVSATIRAPAEFDAYSFEVAAGEVVRMEMVNVSGSSSSMQPQLELFDAMGELLASDAAETSATLERTLDVAGKYYVLASDSGQNDGGSYDLRLERL